MIERDPRFLSIFLNEPIYAVEEPVSPEIPEKEEEVIQYQGQNKEQILILVDDARAEFLPEEDEILLRKILQAVNLSAEDVAIVNLNNLRQYSPTPVHLLNDIPFITLLCFGDVYEEVPFNRYLKKYQSITDEQNRTYLQADELYDIASDRAKKQQLWRCLQEIFQ